MPCDQWVPKSFERDWRKGWKLEHDGVRIIFYACFFSGNTIKLRLGIFFFNK